MNDNKAYNKSLDNFYPPVRVRPDAKLKLDKIAKALGVTRTQALSDMIDLHMNVVQVIIDRRAEENKALEQLIKDNYEQG